MTKIKKTIAHARNSTRIAAPAAGTTRKALRDGTLIAGAATTSLKHPPTDQASLPARR